MTDIANVDGYRRFFNSLESAKRLNKAGVEFWIAREVRGFLGYSHERSFDDVIQKARTACQSAGMSPTNHFAEIRKKVEIGSGAQREIVETCLTRYACYLVALCGDASKPEVAYAKTYFAIQARRQEIQDQLGDEEKRIYLRNRVRNANRALASAAKKAGVTGRGYPAFQDAGYRGLYGGRSLNQIKSYKGISTRDDLLDRADRTELAANEFRITQAEEKLVRDRIREESVAIDAHHEVGQKVRETIQHIGGTMPEDLAPAPNIRQIEAARRKRLKS